MAFPAREGYGQRQLDMHGAQRNRRVAHTPQHDTAEAPSEE